MTFLNLLNFLLLLASPMKPNVAEIQPTGVRIQVYPYGGYYSYPPSCPPGYTYGPYYGYHDRGCYYYGPRYYYGRRYYRPYYRNYNGNHNNGHHHH